MSFLECAQSLRSHGKARINAADFSLEELEAAATLARREAASLIIDNIKGRSCADIARIAAAGDRQISFGDIHLI